MNTLQDSENLQLWDFRSQSWFLFMKSSLDFSSMSLSSPWLHVNFKLPCYLIARSSMKNPLSFVLNLFQFLQYPNSSCFGRWSEQSASSQFVLITIQVGGALRTPSRPTSSSKQGEARLVKASSSLFWKSFEEEDCTSSLGNLLHCLDILLGKMLLLENSKSRAAPQQGMSWEMRVTRA